MIRHSRTSSGAAAKALQDAAEAGLAATRGKTTQIEAIFQVAFVESLNEAKRGRRNPELGRALRQQSFQFGHYSPQEEALKGADVWVTWKYNDTLFKLFIQIKKIYIDRKAWCRRLRPERRAQFSQLAEQWGDYYYIDLPYRSTGRESRHEPQAITLYDFVKNQRLNARRNRLKEKYLGQYLCFNPTAGTTENSIRVFNVRDVARTLPNSAPPSASTSDIDADALVALTSDQLREIFRLGGGKRVEQPRWYFDFLDGTTW